MADQGRSYGGQFAGSDFDLVEFLKRPQTICRLLSLLFSIVVFGCISAGCYDPMRGHCIFNTNSAACHYGVAIGVLAFLGCLLFLAADAQFQNFSNAETRRTIVTVDLGFSGFWAFLWFVGFCFLADQWKRSNIASTYEVNHARAAIAFSFFSIFTWVAMTVIAYKRYRQGPLDLDYQGTQYPAQHQQSQSPYASFPHPGEDEPTYQSAPFGAPPSQPFGAPPVKTEYSVPQY